VLVRGLLPQLGDAKDLVVVLVLALLGVQAAEVVDVVLELHLILGLLGLGGGVGLLACTGVHIQRLLTRPPPLVLLLHVVSAAAGRVLTRDGDVPVRVEAVPVREEPPPHGFHLEERSDVRYAEANLRQLTLMVVKKSDGRKAWWVCSCAETILFLLLTAFKK
jgi:hypothetical protein